VAQHFVQVGTVSVSGVTLQVSPVQRPQICESAQHSTSTSEASITPSPFVEVSWSHDDVNKRVLMLYLENKKRSGGGKVKEMRFFAEKQKAYVQFIDANCKLLQWSFYVLPLCLF